MTADSKQPWRCRVSVRTLLLFVFAFAVWLGGRANRARGQRAAVAAIEQAGGFVTYEDNYAKEGLWTPSWIRDLLGDEYFRQVALVQLFSDRPRLDRPARTPPDTDPDDVLANLGGLPDVRIIHLGADGEPTDAGVAHLAGLDNLQDLAIDRSRLSDEGLRHLAGLPSLEHLSIPGRRFSDQGLAYLKRATRLKSLELGSGQDEITDAGLASLKGLKELEVLDLTGSMVTDEGLFQLEGLTNLKEIRLRWTRVTEAGRRRLRARMPKLETIR